MRVLSLKLVRLQLIWFLGLVNFKFLLTIFIRMNKDDPKVKLTITVDREILSEAKKVAEEKRVPVSRLVENFLKFFANPEVYCFKCGKRFSSSYADLCPKCGWMICPECGGCRCGLDEKTAIAIFHMRRSLEDLLVGRVKGS